MNFHVATPTEAKAIERHRNFLQSIERKAAALQSRKTTDRPACALEPEAFPAEPDPPKHQLVANTVCDRMAAIQRLCCDNFGISFPEIRSARRERKVIMARQLAMYLCKKFTSHSLNKIGGRFGDRDHSTVLHACRRVEQMISSQPGSKISSQWSEADCDLMRAKVVSLSAYLAVIFEDTQS